VRNADRRGPPVARDVVLERESHRAGPGKEGEREGAGSRGSRLKTGVLHQAGHEGRARLARLFAGARYSEQLSASPMADAGRPDSRGLQSRPAVGHERRKHDGVKQRLADEAKLSCMHD